MSDTDERQAALDQKRAEVKGLDEFSWHTTRLVRIRLPPDHEDTKSRQGPESSH